MSGQPPPGYNENLSMLEGGTANITPQAGGGDKQNVDEDLVQEGGLTNYTIEDVMNDASLQEILKGLGNYQEVGTQHAIIEGQRVIDKGSRISEAIGAAKSIAQKYLKKEEADKEQEKLLKEVIPDENEIAELFKKETNPENRKFILQKLSYAYKQELIKSSHKTQTQRKQDANKAGLLAAALAIQELNKRKAAVDERSEAANSSRRNRQSSNATLRRTGAVRYVTNTNKNDPIKVEYYSSSTPLNTENKFRKYISLLINSIENSFKINDYTYIKSKLAAYIEKRMKLWGNSARLPNPDTIKSAYQSEVFYIFNKLEYIVPQLTENIVVIPPIHGDIDSLIRVFITLEKMDVITFNDTDSGSQLEISINKGFILVFMSPFYGPPQKEKNNLLLLSIFLEIETLFSNKIFILSNQTSESWVVGQTFSKYALNSRIPLINWLEPSYIVYNKKRMDLPGVCITSIKEVSGILGEGADSRALARAARRAARTAKEAENAARTAQLVAVGSRTDAAQEEAAGAAGKATHGHGVEAGGLPGGLPGPGPGPGPTGPTNPTQPVTPPQPGPQSRPRRGPASTSTIPPPPLPKPQGRKANPGFSFLKNPSNICYMNSAVQMLWDMDTFKDFFLNISLDDIKDFKIPDDSKLIIDIFRHIFDNIDTSIKSNNTLKSSVAYSINDTNYDGRYNINNKGKTLAAILTEDIGGITRQNDPTEFLNLKIMSKISDLEKETNPFAKALIDSIKIDTKKYYSCKDDMGVKQEKLQNIRPEYNFTFSITDESIVSIQNAYNHYKITESIDTVSKEKTLMEGCKDGIATEQRLDPKISDKVNYIIIGLKRTGVDSIQNQLITDRRNVFPLLYSDDKSIVKGEIDSLTAPGKKLFVTYFTDEEGYTIERGSKITKVGNKHMVNNKEIFFGKDDSGRDTVVVVEKKILKPIVPNKNIILDNKTFRIRGAIIHGGTASGGHYIYQKYDNNGNPTDCISDAARCQQRSQKDIYENGYTFLYERVPGSAPLAGGGPTMRNNPIFTKSTPYSVKPPKYNPPYEYLFLTHRPDRNLTLPTNALTLSSECSNLKGIENADKIPDRIIFVSHTVQRQGDLRAGREEPIIVIFRLKYTKPHIPLCYGISNTFIEPPKRIDKFYPSSQANISGIDTYSIEHIGKTDSGIKSPFEEDNSEKIGWVYSIRRPEKTNRVYIDWMNQIFTADEARFLNTLGFTPAILKEVFKEEWDETKKQITVDENRWKEKLADFLESAVISKCFTDTRFQLASECDNNQLFVEKVFNYFLERDLSIEKINERREKVLKNEMIRYGLELQENNKAKVAHTMEEGDEIRSQFFSETKKEWKTLPTYKTSTGKIATNVITVNKYTGQYTFKRIDVPQEEYDKDNEILHKRIEQLREKYPDIYIIY